MVEGDEAARFWRLSRDLLCVANTEGYFLRLNPRWETVLGWSEEELRSKPFLEFVHPDDVEATIAETAKLAQGIPTLRFENRYRTADGGWKWLAWTCEAQGAELFAIARDITARKEGEALETARMRAEARAHASEVIATHQRLLLNASSHELRTPLTPMQIELAQLRRHDSPDVQRSVKILERNVERLKTIITALVGVADRPSAADEQASTTLGKVVADALASTGTALAVEDEEGLSSELVPGVLATALDAILVNARVHGGGAIAVRLQSAGDALRVEVEDKGPGFSSPELGERWFIPLWRGDHTQQLPGVGLGLTKVRLIAAEAGGRAGVRSEGPGRGTTAWIEVPARLHA